MNTVSSNRSALIYFGLTFALSIPFWIAGTLSHFQILPALPVSALAIFCPVSVAAILVYRANGRAGVVTLLKRSFDFKRVSAKLWYLPTILLMPAIMLLSYGVMRLMGVVKIAVMLRGRAAEKVSFDTLSTGASDDIMRASELARRMVTEHGMSEKLGSVRYAGQQMQ